MSRETGAVPGAQEVADRLAIADVLATYARGIDRVDLTTLKSCFWPDATADYGSFQGPAHTFAEIVVKVLARTYECTSHTLGQTLVAFEGDVARAETYVTAAHLLTGAEREMLFYGRYLDVLEQRDGCWKIAHRQVVIDWAKHVAVDDLRDSDQFAPMARAGRHPHDPLGALLAGEPRRGAEP